MKFMYEETLDVNNTRDQTPLLILGYLTLLLIGNVRNCRDNIHVSSSGGGG
eukprot:SAG31_NODE_1794_length_7249_cov_4.709231_8_plen_51_part_00